MSHKANESELEILKFWEEEDIFNKLREKNKNGKPWSFLDGPITANNPMGVHHAWGRTLKDLFQRYHAMRGEKLRYQNGFDCQGLWVEVEVEKELGFKTKKDIEEYGIGKFVEKCKERVLKYSAIQAEQSKKLGYWMDWENSYYTMSDENNYMIWHFLKKVWQKGSLYKGKDSVPWCPRCGTAISQHEILTEEYKELTHKSIYFKLPIEERQNEYFSVWTTTPWTIPANVALAVNPELTYLKARNSKGEIFYFVSMKDELDAESLKEKTPIEEKFELEVLEKMKGSGLVGLKYRGPFDDLPRVKEARRENPDTFHTVVDSEELVNASEGTGIVHIAPGAGAEDFGLGKEKDLPVIDVIDESAIYLENMEELSGQNAKKNPELIFDYLTEKDGGKFLVLLEDYVHRYPTCWRCKEELVWRVVDEWYISMDELRGKMMEVSKKINWIPAFGLDRELDWLKNMHDWLISKKRYWGLTLPIWECECGHFEVIGSKEELKERAVEGRSEFEGNSPHRPWVDAIKIECPKCGKLVSRIPDVGNPWLDAGIVPFSTFVDPETKKLSYTGDKRYWQEWFPADFVTECFPGQFKNWFYSLIAMATVLENANPFKTLLGHALVKDEHGEEMHKSKGNAIWFDDAIREMGADVMRWMYVSNNPAIDLRFSYKKGGEIRRSLFIPLSNILRFYRLFSQETKIDDLKREDLTNVLDRWISSKSNALIKEVTGRLDEFDPTGASRITEEFIAELSVWYIRRSRGRFKGNDQDEKSKALKTLRCVIFDLARLIAPFLPFTAERIYQEIGGQKPSVHLEDWPEADEEMIDKKLLGQMEAARKICELGHFARKEAQMKVRQPLAALKVKGKKMEESLVSLITDELNVKAVEFVSELPGGEEWQIAGDDSLKVALNLEMTEELKKEGMLRELVRHVNSLRKQAGMTIEDKAKISYFTESVIIKDVLGSYKDQVLKETLSIEISEGDGEEVRLNGENIRISIEKA